MWFTKKKLQQRGLNLRPPIHMPDTLPLNYLDTLAFYSPIVYSNNLLFNRYVWEKQNLLLCTLCNLIVTGDTEQSGGNPSNAVLPADLSCCSRKRPPCRKMDNLWTGSRVSPVDTDTHRTKLIMGMWRMDLFLEEKWCWLLPAIVAIDDECYRHWYLWKWNNVQSNENMYNKLSVSR